MHATRSPSCGQQQKDMSKHMHVHTCVNNLHTDSIYVQNLKVVRVSPHQHTHDVDLSSQWCMEVCVWGKKCSTSERQWIGVSEYLLFRICVCVCVCVQAEECTHAWIYVHALLHCMCVCACVCGWLGVCACERESEFSCSGISRLP